MDRKSHGPSKPSSSSGGSARWFNTRFTRSSNDRGNSAPLPLPEPSSTQRDVPDPSSNRDKKIGTGNAGRWHLRWRPLEALRRVTGSLRHESAPLESGRSAAATSDGQEQQSHGTQSETLHY